MRAPLRAALAATVIVIAVPISARAADDVLSTPDGSPMVFERLAPGYGEVRDVVVRNPSDDPATVALDVRITDEVEAGCLRQELAMEGVGCDDAGELGEWLDVTISRDGRLWWTGTLLELDEPRQLPGSLPAGESWDLEIGIAMPFEAGNDTMTDRISFDLVAHLATDTGEETDVLGAQGSAPGGSEGGASTLVPYAVDAGLDVMGLDALQDLGPERAMTLGTLGLVVVLAIGLVVVERRRSRRW